MFVKKYERVNSIFIVVVNLIIKLAIKFLVNKLIIKNKIFVISFKSRERFRKQVDILHVNKKNYVFSSTYKSFFENYKIIKAKR